MKIGFIGTGNMGGALATAVSKSVGGGEIYLSDPCTDKVTALAKQIGATVTDNEKIAAVCDMIFLGVKPQMLKDLLLSMKYALRNRRNNRPILVSMAAGFSTKSILQVLGDPLPLIRIMPNMPVAVGEGMILYCGAGEIGESGIAAFCNAMKEAGRLCEIGEDKIDAASAISGCGPAFAFMFIDALADAGVECGLPRQQALELAEQTLLGSAKTALDDPRHPAELKDAVCSPGGTTIAGVHALEDGAFRSAVMAAVVAAYERTLELKG